MQRRDIRRRALGLGEMIRLGFLFGLIYFVQGVGDPNTGLVAQPDNSLLRRWGESPKQVATFGALLALPWCLKPLFGLMSDFVPLGRYRRKSYLILTSLIALGGFAALYVAPLPEGREAPLLSWLMLSSVGIIFCDVVVDALMIETGQPLGITGRLQSVQWAAIHTGAILTGITGGFLSENRLQKPAFLLCAGLMMATFVLSVFFVEETPRPPKRSWRQSILKLKEVVPSRAVVVVGLFAFVWSFNPFTQSVLYMHMTTKLRFSDDFYGKTVSLVAVGSLAACVAYGFYCRWLPMRRLIHLSIVGGIVSSWIYWLMHDDVSASIVSVLSGFAYMTGSMVLVDLAARACPLDAPATLFALFMALCNLGAAAGTWFGGLVYERGDRMWGAITSFNVLVLIAGGTTAACWLLVGFLPERLLGVMGEDENGLQP
ncbi:MAG TPA: MFS transporter [Pirellulales bacterium]|nr:MFS transporter [Pirellulales bacterium]